MFDTARKTAWPFTENQNNRIVKCPGSIVRSSIGGCRPPDPGSNPGQGATMLFCHVE